MDTSPRAAKVDAIARKLYTATTKSLGARLGGRVGDTLANLLLAPIRRRI